MGKIKIYRNFGFRIWGDILDLFLVGNDFRLMIIMAFSKANITVLEYVNSLLHSSIS